MKPSKKITIAELVEEIWVRDKVRVVIHKDPEFICRNYRFSRALHGNHTIAHLKDRVQRRLGKSFKIVPSFTIVLGNGSINPRSDMHLRTARKSYKRG
jgi:hypothetical protein